MGYVYVGSLPENKKSVNQTIETARYHIEHEQPEGHCEKCEIVESVVEEPDPTAEMINLRIGP